MIGYGGTPGLVGLVSFQKTASRARHKWLDSDTASAINTMNDKLYDII